MYSNLGYFSKLKPHKKNHYYQKFAMLRFILNLLNIQSDLPAWRPELYGNRTHFPIISRQTEIECASHLVSESLRELEQLEIFRQTV